MRILSVVLPLLLALTSCGKNDPCAEMTEAADAAQGAACGDGADCPSIPCACADGSQVDTTSCFNGSCRGIEACVEVCGEIRECSTSTSANSNTTPGPFTCQVPSGATASTVTCDAATEYCLGSWTGTANLTGPECTSLPSGCNDCDCATEDAKAQFETSNNCDSVVLCQQSGGISIICQQ